MIAQEVVHDYGFVQLDHPAYSPDLAPSDYLLFCNLKYHLRGVSYPDDEALKETVKKWLGGQGISLQVTIISQITMGDFTFWISLSLSLFAQSKD